jgi:hypothetical protein
MHLRHYLKKVLLVLVIEAKFGPTVMRKYKLQTEYEI